MQTAPHTIDLPHLQQLVAEASTSPRRGWTLDSAFAGGDADARQRKANRRASLLQSFGCEAQIADGLGADALYVWRRG